MPNDPIPPSMPDIPDTGTNLQSYFQTGKKPSRYAFMSFIQTMLYYVNLTSSEATAANDQVTDFGQAMPFMFLKAKRVGPNWNILASRNVASVTNTGTSGVIRITFNTPLPTREYILEGNGVTYYAAASDPVNPGWVDVSIGPVAIASIGGTNLILIKLY